MWIAWAGLIANSALVVVVIARIVREIYSPFEGGFAP